MEKIKIKGADVVYRDQVKKNTLKRIKEVLDSGWVILGKNTREFEERFAKYVGRRYGVAVSNDTAALEIACRIIGMKGFKMIVPANGFFSIVTVLDRVGGEPVFLDTPIANNVNFTLEDVKKATQWDTRVKAICLMPCGGNISADVLEIVKYCKEKGIYIIGDNAHGHGTIIKGDDSAVMIGQYEDIACFSFYATKVLNTAEGGMLLFDRKDWYDEARCLRNYGRQGDFGSSRIVMEGHNWRIPEMVAALGAEQVQVIDDILRDRRRVAALYDEEIKRCDGIEPLVIKNMVSNYYKYIVLLKPGIEKYKVKEKMYERGIEISGDVYDLIIPEQPIYKNRFNGNFPEAKDFSERHMCLPFSEVMTQEDVKTVIDNLNEVIDEIQKH